MSSEPKKLALLRILEILEQKTDADHPLKHNEICAMLKEDGIEIERKAVGRNISLLREAGYEIETDQNGTYLVERKFDNSELRLLIDSVLSSRHIPETHSKQLIKKLCSLSNEYFKANVKHVSVGGLNRSKNKNFFSNIDFVDEAIEKNKKLTFDYNKYGEDKNLHVSASHLVSPYQMILHNQHYFLMARNEKWQDITYYRLDKITNVKLTDEPATPLRSIPGYENGIDYSRFSSSLPYMFADEPVNIRFRIKNEWMIDHVVDWFGEGFDLTRAPDGWYVNVRASENAMEYWLMQYLKFVEVIYPASLRQKIAENVAEANEKYNGKKP